MTSVLKPEITSIINGLLTITVRSVTQVEAVFDQLLIFRADSANGPFIGKIEGVETVVVSLKTGLIRVSVGDGMTLDEAEVQETVKDAGFTVESFGMAEPIAIKDG